MLCTFTLIQIRSVSTQVADGLTQIRKIIVSRRSASWLSGGVTHTHEAVQQANEKFDIFLIRFRTELEAAMEDFPKDP